MPGATPSPEEHEEALRFIVESLEIEYECKRTAFEKAQWDAYERGEQIKKLRMMFLVLLDSLTELRGAWMINCHWDKTSEPGTAILRMPISELDALQKHLLAADMLSSSPQVQKLINETA